MGLQPTFSWLWQGISCAQRTQHLSCLEHLTCDGMWGLIRFQRCHPYSSHNDVHLPGWDLGAPTAVAAVSKMYLVHWRKRPGWVKSMINVLIFCKIRGLCLLSFSLRSLGIFFQEPTCYLFLRHRLWHRQLEEVFAKIGKLDSSNVSMKCVRCSHKMLTEDTSKGLLNPFVRHDGLFQPPACCSNSFGADFVLEKLREFASILIATAAFPSPEGPTWCNILTATCKCSSTLFSEPHPNMRFTITHKLCDGATVMMDLREDIKNQNLSQCISWWALSFRLRDAKQSVLCSQALKCGLKMFLGYLWISGV